MKIQLNIVFFASFVAIALSQHISVKNMPPPASEVLGKTIKLDHTKNRMLKGIASINKTFENGELTNQMDSWTDDDVINHHLADPSMEANETFIPPKMPPPAVTEKDFNVPEAQLSSRAAYHETVAGVDSVVNKFSGLVKNLGAKYAMLTAKWNASDINDARAALLRHHKKVAEDAEERRQKAIRLGIPYNETTNTSDAGSIKTGTLADNDDTRLKSPAEENDSDEDDEKNIEKRKKTPVERAMSVKMSKPLKLRRAISRAATTARRASTTDDDDDDTV